MTTTDVRSADPVEFGFECDRGHDCDWRRVAREYAERNSILRDGVDPLLAPPPGDLLTALSEVRRLRAVLAVMDNQIAALEGRPAAGAMTGAVLPQRADLGGDHKQVPSGPRPRFTARDRDDIDADKHYDQYFEAAQDAYFEGQ